MRAATMLGLVAFAVVLGLTAWQAATSPHLPRRWRGYIAAAIVLFPILALPYWVWAVLPHRRSESAGTDG